MRSPRHFSSTSLRGAAVALAAACCAALTVQAPAVAAGQDSGPPTVTADDLVFSRPTQTLHPGTAAQAGLQPGPVAQMVPDVAQYLQPSPNHPEYAGASVLAAHDGVVVTDAAVGYALRYADSKPTDLPRDEWIPATTSTIWDMASMTKLFTSIAAVQLIQQGRLGLDTPVAAYLPQFAQHGKGDITIRNLLTHTSGLKPDPVPSLCTYDTHAEQWDAVYATVPDAPPGTEYVYSDINMMVLGKVVETVTGQTLDQVIAQHITGPLGMKDTMFNPPASLKPRIAAEEYQPWTDRGIVWGSVHDENAYCLGGVSGHAGIFSTTHDIAILAQTLLNGGQYDHTRILSSDSVRSLFRNVNQAFPGNQHGLGFELDQRWYMDALSSPVTAGHTGYTGTSLVIDPLSKSFVILLTNRVHPSRDWGSNNPSRRAVARDLALALPVKPAQGSTAWFSGAQDHTTSTLAIPLPRHDGAAELDFDLWYDTESTDVGRVEVSTDDGTSWQQVPLSLHADSSRWSTAGAFSGFEGRQWVQAAADLPNGTTDVRWRYSTDPLYEGRGVFVDGVRVQGTQGVLFNGSRPQDAARFVANGWSETTG